MILQTVADTVEADTGLDLVAYLIAGLPATIGALTALIIAIRSLKKNSQIDDRQRGHGAVLEEVREQVSNSHDSNLRDDVDRVDAKVDQVDTKVDRLTGTVEALVRGFEAFAREQRAASARQDAIAKKHHPEDMQ